MSRVTDQLVEKILERCSVYRSAFEADCLRLVRQHGHGPVQEALELISRRNDKPADTWDRIAHAQTVGRAIDRVLAERRERGSDEQDPASSWWR